MSHKRRARVQPNHTRRLMAQLLAAEELERKRLARLLHDGPMQDLAAALIALDRFHAGDASLLVDAQHAIQRAVSNLREAVFDLYPPADELGLGVAIRDVAAEITARSGVHVSVEIAPDADGAHDQLLFSLARELLLNAERHAHASHVDVRIRRVTDDLVLEVEDDGVGLAPKRLLDARRNGHIGLASGTERVQALSGDLSIHSSPGSGTAVRVTLPARRAEDRRRERAA